MCTAWILRFGWILSPTWILYPPHPPTAHETLHCKYLLSRFGWILSPTWILYPPHPPAVHETLHYTYLGSVEYNLQFGLCEWSDWNPTTQPVPPTRNCGASRGKLPPPYPPISVFLLILSFLLSREHILLNKHLYPPWKIMYFPTFYGFSSRDLDLRPL